MAADLSDNARKAYQALLELNNLNVQVTTGAWAKRAGLATSQLQGCLSGLKRRLLVYSVRNANGQLFWFARANAHAELSARPPEKTPAESAWFDSLRQLIAKAPSTITVTLEHRNVPGGRAYALIIRYGRK